MMPLLTSQSHERARESQRYASFGSAPFCIAVQVLQDQKQVTHYIQQSVITRVLSHVRFQSQEREKPRATLPFGQCAILKPIAVQLPRNQKLVTHYLQQSVITRVLTLDFRARNVRNRELRFLRLGSVLYCSSGSPGLEVGYSLLSAVSDNTCSRVRFQSQERENPRATLPFGQCAILSPIAVQLPRNQKLITHYLQQSGITRVLTLDFRVTNARNRELRFLWLRRQFVLLVGAHWHGRSQH